MAGEICVVEVENTDFSARFKAVPDQGWYFHRWNFGDRFLCQGPLNPQHPPDLFNWSRSPFCSLLFEGYEENDALEEMVASSEIFYLMPVFKPYQDIIKVNRKEWLQPALFTNLSWNDISAMCSSDTGVCAGELNGYDVSGWTWASLEDVNALFNYYLGRDELGPGPDRYHLQDVPEGPQLTYTIFSDGWLNMLEPNNRVRKVSGLLRSLSSSTNSFRAGLIINTHQVADVIATTESFNANEKRHDSVGAWFYRAP